MDMIIEGDSVIVSFETIGRIAGIVRHIPIATGDSWIIEDDERIYYVQNYSVIEKGKKSQP